jgi:hypothetical protein
VLSAPLAAVALLIRNRHYSCLEAEAERHRDADGVLDIYKSGEPRR